MHNTASITPTTKLLHIMTILGLVTAMALGAATPRPASASTLVVTTRADEFNPRLGSLSDNGGPPQTRVLQPGSPVVDVGNDTHCPTTDQRGVSQSQGQDCDIGAVDVVAIGFSQTSFRVAESAGSATITVTLGSTAPQTVTTQYVTRSGTASASSDFKPVSGTLTLAPGISTITFTVPISDDAVIEPNETIRLTLSAPTNAVLGRSTANLTIVNDDIAPKRYTNFAPMVIYDNMVEFTARDYRVDERAGTATVTATLSGLSSQSVTVRYTTSDGTATAGSDYLPVSGTLTLAPGTRTVTFTVPIKDDKLVEPDEIVMLILRNPTIASLGSVFTATLTILSDEPPLVGFSTADFRAIERTGAAAITATLSHTVAQTVTVQYATRNGTARAARDYTAANGILTFAPGTSAATFTLPISNDTAIEPDETVRVTLSAPTNATLGSTRTATVTIVNDDLPQIGFSASDYTVNEGAGSATITATLSSTFPQTVTVHYTTADGTASALDDYTPVSGTLTLSPGARAMTFTVPISDDTAIEPEESFTVMLNSPTNAVLGATSAATLTITSDDLPQVGFTASTYSGREQDSAALITVTLTSTSQQTITVDFATGDGTALMGDDYTPVSGTLIFAPGSSLASFIVPINNDSLLEPDKTVVLTLTSPTNAMLGEIATATLTIVNDDLLPPGTRSYLPFIFAGDAGIAPTQNFYIPVLKRND